jgi:lipopolysaccharide biosynthesis glycosyltransferase
MYAVALCVDANYLVPALVTLCSIAEAVPCAERAEIAVSITTPDMTRSQVTTASDAARRLGFGSCSIRRVRPPPDSWLRHGAYITGATYLRFAVSKDDFDRPFVLYLDADLIVLRGPSEAFDLLKRGQVGVVQDEIVQEIGRDQALPGFVEAHPGHRGAPYFNAGAIWLASEDLARFTAGSIGQLQRNARHIYFNDQDALNLWLLYEKRAVRLPAAFNRFELGRLRERSDWVNRVVGPPRSLGDAKVIHFIGSHKPWLVSCPSTEAVATYLGLLAETRRLLRRLGDLVLDVPRQAAV